MKKKYLLIAIGFFFLFETIKNPQKVASYFMTKKKLLDKIYLDFGIDISKYSALFGVPQSLITAIIAVESSGNTKATASAGERGLMQITPIALKQVNEYFKKSFTKDDLFIAEKNIIVGTYFLSYLWHKFNNWDLVTRAFNYGEGNIRKNPNLAENYFIKVKKFRDVFST